MNENSLKKIRIFLADDHRILRDGLKQIIQENPEWEVIGEASDGQKALRMILELKPDLAILDISMPGLLGLDIARELEKQAPKVKVIALTKHDNVEYLKDLLGHGGAGYVLKEEAADDLTKAIEVVLSGKIYIAPKMKLIMERTHLSSSGERKSLLTDREREILKLVAEGKKTKDIAELLFISPKTVKVHRANLTKKLKVSSIAELTKVAMKMGLIES